MADKAIGELPQVGAVQDDSMIPLEQNGKAGRMSGEQFRVFAEDSAASIAESVAEKIAMAVAEQVADTGHYTEFGTVNGSGTFYFTKTYTEEPVYVTRGEGIVTWLTDSSGDYIGLSITGTGVTDIVCFCTVT